jgi:hypothetical protein
MDNNHIYTIGGVVHCGEYITQTCVSTSMYYLTLFFFILCTRIRAQSYIIGKVLHAASMHLYPQHTRM